MNYLDQNGLMEFNQDTYNRYTTTAKINLILTNWAKLNYSNRFTREDFGRPSALKSDLFRDLARQGRYMMITAICIPPLLPPWD